MKFKTCKARNILIVAAVSLLSSFLNAADISGIQIEQTPLTYIDNTINGNVLDLSNIGETVKNSKKHASSTRAPASGISYFEVYAVGSSNIGWEVPISSTQSSTAYNHGGSLMRIAVLQVGLGNPNNATMGGSSATRYRTDLLCGSNLHSCSPGEIITGYLYYYSFDGQQGGFFSNSSNSIVYPFGFWQDSISIL